MNRPTSLARGALPLLFAFTLLPSTGFALITAGNFSPGDIVVTEVMPNPTAVTDSAGEWLEVYNAASDDVDLDGLELLDDDYDSHLIAGSVRIPPGGYAVLAIDADATVNGGVSADYQYAGFYLSNRGDEVEIRDGGVTITRMSYTSGMEAPGAALALCSVSDDPGDQDRWRLSTAPYGAGDLGTPGAPNDLICLDPPVLEPGELVITELMPNPDSVFDSRGEWIEVYNPTGAAINMAGMELRDMDYDDHVISGDVVVPAGGFVVLGTYGDYAQNGNVEVDYVYNGFFLGNSGDEIELWSGAILVDCVSYSGSLATAGESLARDCPLAGGLCAEGEDTPGLSRYAETAYHSSSSGTDHGTPGGPNDATPPVLSCPADTTLSADANCAATYAGPAATAADDCETSVSSSPALPVPVVGLGSQTIDWTATDAWGNSSSCTQTLALIDVSAPLLVGVPADQTVECDAVPGPAGVVANDNCDPDPVVDFDEVRVDGNCPGNYTLVRSWTATDASGNASSASRTVTVEDTTGPAIAPGTDDLACVWPPNHQLVCFDTSDFAPVVMDSCSEPVSWVFAGAVSDQDDDGQGDGSTSPDVTLDPDGQSLCVRAERSGGDPDGRRYGVRVMAMDACGNVSAAETIGAVYVPHDRSQAGGDCIRAEE